MSGIIQIRPFTIDGINKWSIERWSLPRSGLKEEPNTKNMVV
jgi:hypothetical protein